jgi:hypothetical protein
MVSEWEHEWNREAVCEKEKGGWNWLILASHIWALFFAGEISGKSLAGWLGGSNCRSSQDPPWHRGLLSDSQFRNCSLGSAVHLAWTQRPGLQMPFIICVLSSPSSLTGVSWS